MSGRLKITTQDSKKATPKLPARTPVNDQLDSGSEESLVLERQGPEDSGSALVTRNELQTALDEMATKIITAVTTMQQNEANIVKVVEEKVQANTKEVSDKIQERLSVDLRHLEGVMIAFEDRVINLEARSNSSRDIGAEESPLLNQRDNSFRRMPVSTNFMQNISIGQKEKSSIETSIGNYKEL